jgi:4-amino-4-deoxy-L-arabinose transferase-like glycosyltransferase
MLKKQHYTYLLILVFLFALAVRLFLAFQTENFEAGDAYFNYRQVESIRQEVLPSYFDDLSYSGRTNIFPPLYYYIISFFSFIMGTTLALKIIPNIIACILVIIIYFIVLELTNKRNIALFCAFTSSFIPIFFASTINSASIFSFTIPLIFYLVYCFMRIKEKKFLHHFLFFAFLLSLTSAISFLFILGLLIYLILVKLEYKLQNRRELEVILFVTFLTLWINVLIYKNAFLFHSYALIWQNIPTQILNAYFKQVDVIASVTNIGLVPLLLGIYAVYRYMFKERDKRTYFLMGFALAVALTLWFRLITLDIGLMFLGAILIPLLGQTLNLFFKYLDMTKIVEYKWVFWIPLVLLVVLTSLLPSIARASVNIDQSVSREELNALEWIKESTPEDAVVLSTIDEGHLITAIAERKNVADKDFILIRSPGDVFDDVEQMYTSFFKTNAVELMNKYNVDYIYFSPRAKEQFSIDALKYVEKDCFELVYNSTVEIYHSFCEVRA